MAKTTVKTINVLCDPGTFFSIGSDSIPVDQLTLEQAELVAAQHPGRFVEVVEKKVSTASSPEAEGSTAN